MSLHNRDIVVIGASAGGVETLKSFFSLLPAEVPAAFFVVVHVWPGGRSFLPDIVRRATKMTVAHGEDGMTIKNGHIYIAPPDHYLLVENGRVSVVRGPRENRCRPAINPLFRSAATAYASRVIGVILSGTMDDGAAGLWAVKQSGGLALVQDPRDAVYPEMPESAINAVEVDHVLPLDALVPELARRIHEKVRSEPARPVAESVVVADGGAKLKPMEMDIDRIAKRSVFSCPECNGALWELTEGGQLSFRCHVGHAYSGRSLRAEQDGLLEQSLWTALRALTESSVLDERLAESSAKAGSPYERWKCRTTAVVGTRCVCVRIRRRTTRSRVW